MNLLRFLIIKTKLLSCLKGQINQRQEKVLLRLFAEGLNGFKGGLSAENYISITKAFRATATRDLADLVNKGALINASCGSTIYEMVHIFDEIFRKICAVDSQRAILKQFFLERSPKDGPVQGS